MQFIQHLFYLTMYAKSFPHTRAILWLLNSGKFICSLGFDLADSFYILYAKSLGKKDLFARTHNIQGAGRVYLLECSVRYLVYSGLLQHAKDKLLPEINVQIQIAIVSDCLTYLVNICRVNGLTLLWFGRELRQLHPIPGPWLSIL